MDEHDEPHTLHGTIVGRGPRKETYLLKLLGRQKQAFGVPPDLILDLMGNMHAHAPFLSLFSTKKRIILSSIEQV